MDIYALIQSIISQDMIDAMGSCAYERLLFCAGLFAVLLPYIAVFGFTAYLLAAFYRSIRR